MGQWQELGYFFTLSSSIAVLVSCSPYHYIAAFLCLFPLHWNVDTILDMLPHLPHNKRSSWGDTLCDVIFIVWKFQTSKMFEEDLLVQCNWTM